MIMSEGGLGTDVEGTNEVGSEVGRQTRVSCDGRELLLEARDEEKETKFNFEIDKEKYSAGADLVEEALERSIGINDDVSIEERSREREQAERDSAQSSDGRSVTLV